MKRLYLLFLLLSLMSTAAFAQRVALRTDLLLWGTTTPNAGVETSISRHFTMALNRENDAIDLPALDFAGDLEALRNLDAALESVVHVVLDEYRGARRSGGVHHLLEAHAHEAHPVVERAAVFVAAVVGIGREELRDEVAVPGVHLDAVETGGMSCSHGLAEVFGNLHYFVPAHFADGGVGV